MLLDALLTVAGDTETRILIAAATNTAVDRVLLGLLDAEFKSFLRVGSRKKISRRLLSQSLHGVSDDESDAAELRELLKDPETTAEDAASIRQELKEIAEGRVAQRRELVKTVRVVGSTCAACVFPVLEDCKFSIVFLDEASQMVEPLSLLPLARFGCKHFVAVGDPMQLRPVLLSSSPLDDRDNEDSKKADVSGLEKTLFLRLMRGGLQPVMLRTQYRCHPVISAISNRLFYSGKLLDGVSEEQRGALVAGLPPVVLVVSDGGGREEVDQRSGSVYNESEARAAVAVVRCLERSGVADDQIGVIALYKAQAALISQGLCSADFAKVQVSTVDAFQGAEKDVIVVSCCRTGSLGGFVESPKRLNVAITRARRHLFVVGDPRALSASGPWSNVIAPALATSAAGGLQSATVLARSGGFELAPGVEQPDDVPDNLA